MKRRIQTAGLAAAATLATVLAFEVGFRLVGHDFSGKLAAWEAHPIYYRLPREPVGPVFFHRSGPATWVGNVLSQGFRARWGDAGDPYPDEPAITAHYDRDGFRNPDDLEEWEVVVVGDSFSELGYLADEDLFSSQLARRLGVRVRNLGVSYTGPLAQRFYLEEYGASPALEHAILVFFEGNDLVDLAAERAALQRRRQSGTRPERVIAPQTSLLRHLRERLLSEPSLPSAPDWDGFLERHQAWFRSEGGEIPVTLNFRPPGHDDMPERQAFEDALAAFAGTAERLGAAAWLVYMPCKRRALDGHLRFAKSTVPELVRWRPTDLPDYARRVAVGLGLHFIDLTPAFGAEAARGRLLYNGLWDTHLNRAGSHLTGKLIADAVLARGTGPSAADPARVQEQR